MSITHEITVNRVSSVLNNDRKEYGKKHLFDKNDESCWNSDQGCPQWIEFGFPTQKTVTKIRLQFQGGFAGKMCELEALDPSSLGIVYCFDPVDNNSMQEFDLDEPMVSKNFRISFRSSTDFYGRIILYHVDVIGT